MYSNKYDLQSIYPSINQRHISADTVKKCSFDRKKGICNRVIEIAIRILKYILSQALKDDSQGFALSKMLRVGNLHSFTCNCPQ